MKDDVEWVKILIQPWIVRPELALAVPEAEPSASRHVSNVDSFPWVEVVPRVLCVLLQWAIWGPSIKDFLHVGLKILKIPKIHKMGFNLPLLKMCSYSRLGGSGQRGCLRLRKIFSTAIKIHKLILHPPVTPQDFWPEFDPFDDGPFPRSDFLSQHLPMLGLWVQKWHSGSRRQAAAHSSWVSAPSGYKLWPEYFVFGYMLQFPTRCLRYFVTCVIYSKEALDIHPTQVYWHQFLENESLNLRKNSLCLRWWCWVDSFLLKVIF